MKTKGFTLIELLAVIVILAIILVIAVPSVMKVISSSRYESFKRSEEIVTKAVESYLMKNMDLLPATVGVKSSVLYTTLKSEGYISNVVDPVNKSECTNSKIYVEKNADNSYKYTPGLICENFISLNTYSIITNGDFSNGTSGWGVESASVPVISNNTATVTSNGITWYSVLARPSTVIATGLQNHILFLKAKVRVTNSSAISFWIGSANGLANLSATGSYVNISTPISGQWYDIYGIVNFASGTDVGTIVKIYMQYASPAIANGKSMEIKDVYTIDLTEMYGATIPALSQINQAIDNS